MPPFASWNNVLLLREWNTKDNAHVVHSREVHRRRTKPAYHGVSDQRRPEVQQRLVPIDPHHFLRSRHHHRGLPPLLLFSVDRSHRRVRIDPTH